MSCCVTGITGLQLFWNYQNYKNTVKTFNVDTNAAFQAAIDKETAQRYENISIKFRGWLSDTSFVQITADSKNRAQKTVFHLNDTHPAIPGKNGASIGFMSFHEKLDHITPSAKTFFINQFSVDMLKRDLMNGNIYFYTQRLGDSLSLVYDSSKLNPVLLAKLYQQELRSKGINSSFTLNTTKPKDKNLFTTQLVNTALRKPYHKEFITAVFENPDSYYLKEMKWVIITSFLLISITLFCFVYTSKTLLSQHKLAKIKDDFINNMTHEINTPLASIGITTQALKKFDYDQNTRNDYLNIISYQVEKLTSLSTQILNSASQANFTSKDDEPVELNALIKKAIYEMTPQITNSNGLVNFSSEEQNIYVQGESKTLLNAFTNIIDNALKYNTGILQLDITLSHQHKQAKLTFEDNGIGIPIVYIDRIFEQFFRVPTGNTHNVKGYGLGLNYVRQVVQQHKGTISLTPNIPYGSIFTFKFPLN